MEQLKPQGRNTATLQAYGSQPHDQSQLPLITGLTDVLAMRDHAGANETEDASNGAHAPNPFDVDIDPAKIAQTAIGSSQDNHQASDMESIKASLRNFLDDIKEVQTEGSSYFNKLISQWLSIWRTDRIYSLLIYVLGDRSEQYGHGMVDFKDLDEIDKTKTRFLEQQCLQQPVCLYLAKMLSTVNTDPNNALDLKMAINLQEIRDLSGEIQVNKPVAAGGESVIQKSILKERYHQQKARKNPYPSPTEGRSPLQIDTGKSCQDWVSLPPFSLSRPLSMDSSHNTHRCW